MIEIGENSNSKSEQIKSDKAFEDFICSYSLSEQNSIKGKLYYTENNIEFKSEREENKINLNFKDINNIIINNDENIEIETKEKKFIFFFFR